MAPSIAEFRAQFELDEGGRYRLSRSGLIGAARFSEHEVDALVARYRSGLWGKWRLMLITAGMAVASAVSYADHQQEIAIGAAVLVALGVFLLIFGVRRGAYWTAWWRGALGLEPHEEPIAESRGAHLLNAVATSGMAFLMLRVASQQGLGWIWAWLALVAWVDLLVLLWRRHRVATASGAPVRVIAG